MKKTTIAIMAGMIGMAGMSMLMSDKKTRKRMNSEKRKFVAKTNDFLEDITSRLG